MSDREQEPRWVWVSILGMGNFVARMADALDAPVFRLTRISALGIRPGPVYAVAPHGAYAEGIWAKDEPLVVPRCPVTAITNPDLLKQCKLAWREIQVGSALELENLRR